MPAILELIPVKVRAWVYAILAASGTITGAVQVAYIVIGVQPLWLSVAIAVQAFLAASANTVASSNTPVPRRALEE
jgi:hypothetical protein